MHKYADHFGADSIISSQLIWETGVVGGDWRGYKIGEITAINDGSEIIYCTNISTMTLKSFPGLSLLWNTNTAASVFGIYNNFNLFNEPKMMTGNPYKLFSGFNGALSAAFVNQGITLSDIIDLDNDGEDELLSYTGNTLHIYHAVLNSVGIDDNLNSLPASFRLYANYPNPFNASTIIKYDLPKEADVRINVYDLLGRKIETLAQGKRPAGTHQVVWDGSGVSSGIYFYKLQAGNFSESKRMLLLK